MRSLSQALRAPRIVLGKLGQPLLGKLECVAGLVDVDLRGGGGMVGKDDDLVLVDLDVAAGNSEPLDLVVAVAHADLPGDSALTSGA